MPFFRITLIPFSVLAVLTVWVTSHFLHLSFYGFIGPYETHGGATNGMISFSASYEGGLFFTMYPVIAPYDSPEEFFAITKPTIVQTIFGTMPDFFLTFRNFFPNKFGLSVPTWFLAILIASATLLAFGTRSYRRRPNKPALDNP